MDRRRCIICDKSFVPGRSDAVYCGGGCRQRAHRIRRVFGDDVLRRIVATKVGPLFVTWTGGTIIRNGRKVFVRGSRPRGAWRNSGVSTRGIAVTFRSSEALRNPVEVPLSAILERRPVDPKYHLSAKAASGILRRAKKRGRELPPGLRAALERTAKNED